MDRGDRLVLSAEKKTPLFLANFKGKQSKNSFQQPHSRGSSIVLCSVTFRSSIVRSLLLRQEPYNANGPDAMFLLFH